MRTSSQPHRSIMAEPSLEMTGKDVDALRQAAPLIAPGTLVNVTFLGNEDLEMRVTAAETAKALGFIPVPHISARRLRSQVELEEFLSAIRERVGTEYMFAVGGDPTEPMGPYDSALKMIETGLLKEYGFRNISIAGYPESHPDITEKQLWDALEGKVRAFQEQRLEGTILTQFGFDTDPILAWTKEVRRRRINLPVRIGVPGPAGIKRLLNYGRRFGVSTSTGIAKKYGLSLTNLLGTAGPEKMIADLQTGLDPALHGEVRLHFYTFGGMEATAEWINQYKE
ncbi:methylenetetrahydrofolate reductase [Nesterenkonia muleiensis]|uniref:methylenetetrahydrofolate reductase n=1 Tax=Nesterenkonia muleiensis TaxID=2282648 RepID=UPI000E75C9BA|nr:methylenetetrahydrofolate reductase [Nesterenkonia muleiensis]